MKSDFPHVFLQSRYLTTDLFPFVEKLKPLALFSPKNDNSLLQENYALARLLTKAENIAVQIPWDFQKKYQKQLKKKKEFAHCHVPVTSSTLISLLFFLLENKFEEDQKIVVLPADAFFVPASELIYVLRNVLYKSKMENVVFLQTQNADAKTSSIEKKELLQIEKQNKEVVFQNKNADVFVSSGCVILHRKIFLRNCEKFFPDIFNTVSALVQEKKETPKKYAFVENYFTGKNFPSLTIEQALFYFNKQDSSFLLHYQPVDFQVTVPKDFSSLLSLMIKDEKGNKKYRPQQTYFYGSKNNSLLVDQNQKSSQKKKIIFSSCKNLMVIENDDYLLIHQASAKKTSKKVASKTTAKKLPKDQGTKKTKSKKQEINFDKKFKEELVNFIHNKKT